MGPRPLTWRPICGQYNVNTAAGRSASCNPLPLGEFSGESPTGLIEVFENQDAGIGQASVVTGGHCHRVWFGDTVLGGFAQPLGEQRGGIVGCGVRVEFRDYPGEHGHGPQIVAHHSHSRVAACSPPAVAGANDPDRDGAGARVMVWRILL
jgi:hypothetical protein